MREVLRENYGCLLWNKDVCNTAIGVSRFRKTGFLSEYTVFDSQARGRAYRFQYSVSESCTKVCGADLSSLSLPLLTQKLYSHLSNTAMV